MKKLIIPLMLLNFSCTKFSFTRAPASISSSPIMNTLLEIEDDVGLGVSSTKECYEKLDKHYLSLFNIDSKSSELASLDDNQMNDFVKTSFKVRLEIKEKLKTLSVTDDDGKRCLKSVKNIVRALRYFEDYLVEYSYKRQKSLGKEYVTLEGLGSHFVVNKDYDFKNHKDLKSGDVILSRGNAYSSAAIARIGDDDTQFSHLTLVYEDENKELHTSEAHIEIGNVVAPIKIHIDQKNARTVVFRHSDKKLAHRAGEYMYHKLKRYTDTRKKNIPYDFSMTYDSDDSIFCSEVIYHGYKEAGKELYNEEIDLPLYKTKFNPGQIPFLRKIGIPVNKKNIDTFDTFGPGEIQFDPRFDIVAEWRNPAKLQDSRFKDAILTKLFKWMEEENYKFRPTFGNSVGNSVAWLARRAKWSRALIKAVSGKNLEEAFPLNMSVKQMNLFVVLDKVGETLYKKLEKEQAKSNIPLSFKELFTILEDFKTKDFAAYKKYKADQRYNRRVMRSKSLRVRRRLKRPSFHLKFRPDKY